MFQSTLAMRRLTCQRALHTSGLSTLHPKRQCLWNTSWAELDFSFMNLINRMMLLKSSKVWILFTYDLFISISILLNWLLISFVVVLHHFKSLNVDGVNFRFAFSYIFMSISCRNRCRFSTQSFWIRNIVAYKRWVCPSNDALTEFVRKIHFRREF